MHASQFEVDLGHLINRYSQENASGTPDWILAQFLLGCLSVFNSTIKQREKWYGRAPRYDPTIKIEGPDYNQFPKGDCQ